MLDSAMAKACIGLIGHEKSSANVFVPHLTVNSGVKPNVKAQRSQIKIKATPRANTRLPTEPTMIPLMEMSHLL